MWHFNAVDELRHEHLLGLRREDHPPRLPPTSPNRRRYLLSVARRFCKWRDGEDPRRVTLSALEAARVEQEMLRDLVPMETPSQAHSPIRPSWPDHGTTSVAEI